MPATLPSFTTRTGAALLLVGGLLASRPAAAQWVQQNSNLPELSTVNSISIVDANTVWASASDFNTSTNPNGTSPNNRYIRTTNGGTNWAVGTIPDAANYAIQSISAGSSRVAWVATDNLTATSNAGRLYYTSDGGTTWTRQLASAFGGSAGFINGVLAFSTTQAAAVGDPNTAATFEAYYTTDGTTWQAATTPNRLTTAEYGLAGTVVTVPGTNAAARSCWMGTNAGRVLRSTDSGVTWQAATTGLTAVSSLAFCSPTTGLAVYSNTSSTGTVTVALAYTTDGGATWTTRSPSGPFYPSTISGVPGLARGFVSAGFANGGTTYGTSYSIDGGTTWVALDAQLHYSVAFLNGTTGYSGGFSDGAGTGGMFKGTLPASVLATTATRQLPGLSVYPNPATDRFTVAVPAVAEATRVQATLYNALGQAVARQEAALPAGGTQLSFPATGLAAGLYTLRVQAGDATASQQVSLR